MEYDEFLEDVEESHIRPMLPLMEIGKRDLANFGGEGMWFPGIIDEVNTHFSTYNIKYDDGDYENSVSRDRLKYQT